MVLLSMLLRNSDGIEKDGKQGFTWIERSAIAGSGIGMFQLSELYHNGIGVSKVTAAAKTWLHKFAQASEPLDITNLGKYFYQLSKKSKAPEKKTA